MAYICLMQPAISFQFEKAKEELKDFVFGFSYFKENETFENGVIVPNGRIDLLFCKLLSGDFQIALLGLESKPKPMLNRTIEMFFGVSFNPLALEYILHQSIADFVNGGMILPQDFWGVQNNDLDNFGFFCNKISSKISSLIPNEIDERKLKLFRQIFASDGEISVKELSEKIYWSERQINRYFKQYLGISLKAYCNILRFQASLKYIKEGQLYPQLNYTDQSHFIKEIKKLSGVSPKELYKNPDQRFLQFLVFDK